jgi:hypothetical protein
MLCAWITQIFANRRTSVVEHQPAFRQPMLLGAFDHFEQLSAQRQYPALLVLAERRSQPHDPIRQIYVAPFERAHFGWPPSA